MKKDGMAMTRKQHDLRILPEYFEAIERGEKNYEVRFNDRNFVKGDSWCQFVDSVNACRFSKGIGDLVVDKMIA